MHVHNNVSTSISRSGQEALFFECDLLNRESIDQLCSIIASKVPSGIDILVNNAGKLTVSILTYSQSYSTRRVSYSNTTPFINIPWNTIRDDLSNKYYYTKA